MVDEDFLIRHVDSFQAKLIKVNKRKDLAMLEVSNLPLKIKPVKYGKFDDVKIGETLFAIGHPKDCYGPLMMEWLAKLDLNINGGIGHPRTWQM